MISSSLTASSTYISKHCYLYPSPLSNYISNCYLLSPLGYVCSRHLKINTSKPAFYNSLPFLHNRQFLLFRQKFLSHFWFPSFPHTGIQSKPSAYSISTVFQTGSESKHFLSPITTTSYHHLSTLVLAITSYLLSLCLSLTPFYVHRIILTCNSVHVTPLHKPF